MKKKTKIQPSDPKTLYVIYDQDEHGGDLIDPEEQWSDRTHLQITVKFTALVREQLLNRMFYDSVEVDDKTFESSTGYLAVVSDSFGNSSGHWHIVGCYISYTEAEKQLKIALESKDSYKPWEGYFESLENTEVHPLPIS